MKLKTLAAAIAALFVTGTAALADCSMHGSETQAMSCAEGSMMDEETGTCVPIASS
ncbi:MAG: hypothetical protein HLUCCA08_04540 [Rhodobacteraceae bacterium HLUCCA08]|nr:MAG: hypothetical protein HLUCCA08_04540 [Rhodobacteraceae bacterium HLUCCA08]